MSQEVIGKMVPDAEDLENTFSPQKQQISSSNRFKNDHKGKQRLPVCEVKTENSKK